MTADRRGAWKSSACRAAVAFAAFLAVVPGVHAAARSAEPPATRPLARRILFLGNSITLHGPKADIGWTGDWGMAASGADRDYVHLIAGALAARAGTAPEVMVENIADFERTPDTFDLKARLEKPLAFGADIVVVAIGENVPALRTDAARAAFRGHVRELLATVKGKGGPAVYVRGCFGPDPAKDEVLKQAAAAEAGVTFVDISAVGRDPANRAGAERPIAHQGVAGHPGDKGMRAIADALLKAIADGPASPKRSE
jgi:hypothetical protein